MRLLTSLEIFSYKFLKGYYKNTTGKPGFVEADRLQAITISPEKTTSFLS